MSIIILFRAFATIFIAGFLLYFLYMVMRIFTPFFDYSDPIAAAILKIFFYWLAILVIIVVALRAIRESSKEAAQRR